jgi:hypothetical protein
MTMEIPMSKVNTGQIISHSNPEMSPVFLKRKSTPTSITTNPKRMKIELLINASIIPEAGLLRQDAVIH